ncbi:MAG: class I SAM-dependent methyltransferase, partial [Myxococcota bacterium]
GDRGFGASVGSFAAPIFADLLRVRGFEVDVRRADWDIGPTSPAMLSAMVDGIAQAAREGLDPARVAAWAADRRAQVAASDLTLRVGHLDVLGLPGRG